MLLGLRLSLRPRSTGPVSRRPEEYDGGGTENGTDLRRVSWEGRRNLTSPSPFPAQWSLSDRNRGGGNVKCPPTEVRVWDGT